MNELTTVNKQVQEIANRAEILKTANGQRDACKSFIKIFAVLEAYGYIIPQSDTTLLASTWVNILSEYITVYGMKVINQAFHNFVKQDSRSYKGFPKPAEIITEIKNIGGKDPRLIQQQMMCKEAIEKSVKDWEEENKQFWKDRENKNE